MPDRPALFFDVMDTLIVDPFHDALPAFFGLDLPGYLAAKEQGTWVAFETARCSEEQFLATMFTDRRPVDGDALRAVLTQSYRWVHGMEALLAELRDGGVEIHVMSNYPVWYHLIEEELGLSRYVEWTFVSWDQGLRKPDRRAFARAAALVMAERGLLVDDRESNVQGARAAGWDAVHFEGVDPLREALRARGYALDTLDA